MGLPLFCCVILGSQRSCVWFNTTELCLAIEEFSAILGYDPSKKFVAVSYDPRHKESLSGALGLPISITDSMIEGHMVNLRATIS